MFQPGLGAFIDNVVILGQPWFMASGRVTDSSSNPISSVAVSAGPPQRHHKRERLLHSHRLDLGHVYPYADQERLHLLAAVAHGQRAAKCDGAGFLAIPRPQGGLSVTTDISGQLSIENDFYRIELTNASSFVVKTGAGEREWQIFNPCASGRGWIGIVANTQDHQGVWLWNYPSGVCMSPESVTILQQTPTAATVQVVVSGTAPVGTVRVASTFTFRADSSAIRVESEVLSSTVSSPVVTFEYLFCLGAGGDTANDWYTWAGGTPTAFPYSDWRTFYASDFAPLANDYIHLSVYDSAAQQGMALVTRLSDTSNSCSDICYGRATVEGEIYGYKPHFDIHMAASRRDEFYIYPFTAGAGNPIAPVESFINSLSSISRAGVGQWW